METFSKRNDLLPTNNKVIIEDAPDWLRIKILDIIFHYIYDGDEEQAMQDSKLSDIIGISDVLRKPFFVKEYYESACSLIKINPDEEFYKADKKNIFIEKLLRSIKWFNFYDILEMMAKRLAFIQQQYEKSFTEYKKNNPNRCFEPTDFEIREKEEELVEFKENFGYEEFIRRVNSIFQDGNIGWQFDQNCLLFRTMDKELEEQVERSEKILADDKYVSVRQYVQESKSAIYKSRPIQTYESIHQICNALESLSYGLTNDNKFKNSVRKLNEQNKLPSDLVKITFYFYEYACNYVRHGQIEKPTVSIEDAEFCFHLGVAIIQYIINSTNEKSN